METYIFLFQFQNANFLPIGLFWAAFMTFDSRGVKKYGDTLMALSHCTSLFYYMNGHVFKLATSHKKMSPSLPT